MEVKHIVENLIKDIQEIEKFINAFKNSSHISHIETDLILSRLQNLYATVLQLREIPEPVDEDPVTDTAPEEIAEAAAEKEEPVEEKGVKEDEAMSHDFELESESKGETGEGEKTEKPEPEDTEKKENASPGKRSSAIIADRLAGSKQFRNEELGKSFHGTDLSSKLQSKPLKDIGAAIGVNDRFYYIRELFNGDSNKFDNTIKVLNNSPNFNEAFNYLSENYNWDMDDPAVQNLLELIRRKHIINTDE